MSVTLTDNYPIRNAGIYTNPKQESDLLPVPYGDLRYGSGAIWPCPCIDTVNFKYCVADCTIDTDNLTLYDGGSVTSNYTVAEVDGVTIATFSSEPAGDISARGTGKEVGGVRLQDLDILEDIFGSAGYDTENGIDWYAWNVAKAQLQTSGIKLAGVILQERTLQELSLEILASFLGNLWQTAENKLYLSCDIVGLLSYPIHGVVSERKMSDPLAEQRLENLCNQAQVYFAPRLLSSDRRFKEGGDSDFAGYDNGSSYANFESQGRYGIQTGDEPFTCRWLYDKASVNVFQARIVQKFAWPLWVVSFVELSHDNRHVQQGQYLAFSWRGLSDDKQRPLRNQIGRVMSKRLLLNQTGIEWNVVDAGVYLSYPPAVLDGSTVLDGSLTLGGQRNQEKL